MTKVTGTREPTHCPSSNGTAKVKSSPRTAELPYIGYGCRLGAKWIRVYQTEGRANYENQEPGIDGVPRAGEQCVRGGRRGGLQGEVQMCHGPTGDASSGMAKSMGLKPLNSADVQKISAADMTALVANGKGKMPAFKGKISDEDVTAVVGYVKSLK